MKRLDLVRHLVSHDCKLDREGRRHSIYVNRVNGSSAAVPRHREIKEYLARTICDALEIPRPRR